MEERLSKHLKNHSGFTGKAKDWQVVFVRECESKSEAYDLERKLKALKSRVALEKLIKA
jgi:putative endonuclease